MSFTGRKLQIVFLVFIYPLGIVNQMARTTFILLFSFVIRNEFYRKETSNNVSCFHISTRNGYIGHGRSNKRGTNLLADFLSFSCPSCLSHLSHRFSPVESFSRASSLSICPPLFQLVYAPIPLVR